MTKLYRMKPLEWVDNEGILLECHDRFSIDLWSTRKDLYQHYNGRPHFFGAYETVDAAKAAAEKLALEEALRWVEAATPEVTPEAPRWIPVGERMPPDIVPYGRTGWRSWMVKCYAWKGSTSTPTSCLRNPTTESAICDQGETKADGNKDQRLRCGRMAQELSAIQGVPSLRAQRYARVNGQYPGRCKKAGVNGSDLRAAEPAC